MSRSHIDKEVAKLPQEGLGEGKHSAFSSSKAFKYRGILVLDTEDNSLLTPSAMLFLEYYLSF